MASNASVRSHAVSPSDWVLTLRRSRVPGATDASPKEDVEAAHAAQEATSSVALAPSNAALGQQAVREGMSAMRLTIARRLVESKQTIPHYRVVVDVQMDALLERRKALKAANTDASVNDLLIRACALALLRHPQVNSQIDDQSLLRYPHADIAVAVATATGLITPIVRSADTKSVAAVAQETVALIARAQSGGLTREEFTGGTFTLSNLGMFGVDRFDAIINPPQVAILAVGAARESAVVRDGAVQVARIATLTFSFDHRVVDGAEGARFAASVRELIEKPESL